MPSEVKRKITSGCVIEQEVYYIAPNRQRIATAQPILRFKNEEERAAHRTEMSRRHHTRLFNSNFTPQSLYSTLTFDNDHEVHTFDEARRVATLFMRRLKDANPDARIMLYMGRGKSTDRIHFHMVSNGLAREIITSKWKAGMITRIVSLRANNKYDGIDHGPDYTGLANYLFDHWTPEQGGNRWRATRNLQQPEKQKSKRIKRKYSKEKPPRLDGYMLVEYKSKPTGYQYFKYVKIPEKPPPRKRQ